MKEKYCITGIEQKDNDLSTCLKYYYESELARYLNIKTSEFRKKVKTNKLTDNEFSRLIVLFKKDKLI